MTQTHRQNWFEMAKGFDLKDYMIRQYGMDFKRNFALCPFHADSKPTLSVQTKKQFFQCFACGAAGDIVKFVELHDKLSPLEAVKKVLSDHGMEVGGAKEMSAEERAERQKQLDSIAQEAEKKRASREQDEARDRKKAIETLTKYAPIYAENLHTAIQNEDKDVIKNILGIIPRFWSLPDGVSDMYMGYDYENEAICFINRDASGRTFNIKPQVRKGFPKNWEFGGEWVPCDFQGKWVSWKNATTYPFGSEFINEDDDRVVICEGEKDALNLMSYGINALTLGGVTSRWEPFLNLLKGKRVFVWFDNDRAGYEESVKRWGEINGVAKSCHVVLFYKLGSFSNKYDISDYLAENKFSSKDEIFTKIIYSCFSITNDLLDEILELHSDKMPKKDFEQLAERLAPYRVDVKILKFSDIKKQITDAVQDIKGEKDEQVKVMQHLAKELEDSKVSGELEKLINSLFSEAPGFLEKMTFKLREVVRFQTTLLNNYRQTHIYDMVVELLRATKASGFMFAKYRGYLYIWTGNYFYRLEKWEISDFVLQNYFRAAKVDFKKQLEKNAEEVIANLKAQSPSLESWIDPGRRTINMLNGSLIVPKSGKYLFKDHHSKKDCALNILPVYYDKNAKAPKWQAFLNRVLPEKEDQKALMEFFGYCFLPSHRFETFLLLYGATGANGKSVILQVMGAFFGRENISSLQLHEFEGHPLAMLQGKILNIGTEIESGGDLKKQFSTLKALISPNDSIAINPKMKDGFDLLPEQKPKCANAANKLPKSGMDGGVFRRALVFEMDQEIPDNEKVRDLVERFEDERAGILNMALEGLTRLITQNKFSMSEKRAAFMESYKDDVNPVRAYLNECTETAKGVCVPKKFIYEHYKAWAEDKGLQPYATRTFWGKVKEQIKFTEKFVSETDYRHKFLGKRNRFLIDFALKNDVIDEFKVKGEDVSVADINLSTVGFYPISL